jgi:hypothetical protein
MIRKLLIASTLALLFACPNNDDDDDTTPPPPPPPPTPVDGGPIEFTCEDLVDCGRDLYFSLRCSNCHAPDGTGNAQAGGPNILGRTADDIRREVIEPCVTNEIGTCHPLKLPDLRAGAPEELAAYIEFLGGALPPADPGPPCTLDPGAICTVMGNGQSGNIPGDGITGRAQRMFWPQNTAVDPTGRLVATDWNNYLMRRLEVTNCVDADGNACDLATDPGCDCPITNIVGTSELGDTCSTDSGAGRILASQSSMNHPVGIHFRSNGDMILYGWHQWKIKYMHPEGQDAYGPMYCVWGNDRGFSGDGNPAGTGRGLEMPPMSTPVRFNLPSSAVEDNAGNWYVSDQANVRIRIIPRDADDVDDSGFMWAASRRNNIISTWAGGEPRDPVTGDHAVTNREYSNSGDGGPITQATFSVQFGFDALPQLRLAIDNDRNFMYVADAENGRIRRIDLNQNPPIIDTYAGCIGTEARGDLPDEEATGCYTTATGTTATRARLYRPADVDLIPDGSGDIVVTDVYNNCIRIVRFSDQTIHTVAGQCGARTYGYSGDGGPAIDAQLSEPGGAGVASDRTIYIADTLNHRIRRVNPRPNGQP